jgi:multiple sugar transport system permease protein
VSVSEATPGLARGTSPGQPARPRRSRLARRRAGILLSLPAVIVVVALLGIPIGQAVYYSMTNWNGLTAQWIGPSTYSTALSDPVFWRVLQNNGGAAARCSWAWWPR